MAKYDFVLNILRKTISLSFLQGVSERKRVKPVLGLGGNWEWNNCLQFGLKD